MRAAILALVSTVLVGAGSAAAAPDVAAEKPTSANPAGLGPAGAAALPAAVIAQAEPSTSWHLGAHAGALLPRGDLDVAATAGLKLAMAPRDGRLRFFLGFDWSLLGQQDSTMVGPPDFPRARADLIQSSHELGFCVGASYDLIDMGPVHGYLAAGLGVAISRSEFDAFSSTVVDNDASALFSLSVGVRGPLSSLFWSVDLAWRESTHDLGDAGDFGESSMVGAVATVGLGYAFR